MARIQVTPRYPMGTRIRKRFDGYTDPFSGKVDAFIPASGFYHITYDDGDSEEMTEDDVKVYLDGKARKVKRPPPSSAVAVSAPKPAPPPKLKTLNLSAPAQANRSKKRVRAPAPLVEDEDDSMADGEQDEDGDGEEGEEEEEEEGEGDKEEEVICADPIYQLVGKRVCKKQNQGTANEAIVTGTVSTYFPATKMYRVFYNNGTTDDMTFREVVDSISLSAPSASKKRKSVDRAGNSQSPRNAAPASPKKQKVTELKIRGTAADENANSENTSSSSSSRSGSKTLPDRGKSTAATTDRLSSLFEMPTCDEDSFVWNKKAAFDMVRAVLYVVVSTTSKHSDPLKSLEQKELKGKEALEMFVKTGGLVALEERLTTWCKEKETEAGVLAILKVLSVIPGITTEAVLASKIGKTLKNIEKGRLSSHFDRIVPDLAAWVIKKWKKDMGMNDVKPEKKQLKDDKSSSKPLSNIPTAKPTKSSISSGESQSSFSSAAKKRSNSVGHLRHLISGPRTNQRSGDFLGSALNGRSAPRKLGPQYARTARRSTVLLDSIANRVIKNSDADKSASSSGVNRPTAAVDTWTASRVKFGDHKTVVFDNDIEVSLLLIAPTQGAIRPYKPKSALAKPPTSNKVPTKSILRVKLDAAEQEANVASARVEDSRVQSAATEQIRINSGSIVKGSTGTTEPDDIRGDDTARESVGDEDDAAGDMEVRIAPPSPPRKHDASEDEDDGETDLPPMPDDLMIVTTSSPPSSEAAGEEQNGEVTESVRVDASADDATMADKDEGTRTDGLSYRVERVARPEVSESEVSHAESGEIVQDVDMDKAHLAPKSEQAMDLLSSPASEVPVAAAKAPPTAEPSSPPEDGAIPMTAEEHSSS